MPATSRDQVLRLLIQERDRLDEAIQLLQNKASQQAPAPRRGRPPKGQGKTVDRSQTGKRRGRPPMTAEEKRAASERMKKYWAERKTAKKAAKGAKKKTKKAKRTRQKAAKTAPAG